MTRQLTEIIERDSDGYVASVLRWISRVRERLWLNLGKN